MHDWFLRDKGPTAKFFLDKEIHPKDTSRNKNEPGMHRTADTKATCCTWIYSFLFMLSMTCLLIIIKLHNSPRWKSSPLEMATVTVDTSKCDHNTNSDAAATPPTEGAAKQGRGLKERESESESKKSRARSNTADIQRPGTHTWGAGWWECLGERGKKNTVVGPLVTTSFDILSSAQKSWGRGTKIQRKKKRHHYHS